MIKNKYNIIFGIILLWVVFDSIQVFINPHGSIFVKIVKEYYFEKVLQNTQYFYKAYNTPLETDEVIMLNWLWPEMLKGVDIKYKDDPFFRLQNKEFKIEKYTVDADVKKFMIDPTDEVIFKTLYCDENGYNDRDYKSLKNIRDGVGGYGDTHFLIGLLLVESLNCVENTEIQDDKNDVIQNIIKAENNDGLFSDLFAERVVVLYWAGANDEIKYSWIEKIASNQKLGGGWAEIGNKNPDPHITGLSALAIKYFVKDEMSSVWFVN